jgi:hypothetical protein
MARRRIPAPGSDAHPGAFHRFNAFSIEDMNGSSKQVEQGF